MHACALVRCNSSPCCASYCLKKTAEDNAENFSPEATRAVERAFYVDYFLHSVSTKTEAIRLIGEVRDLLLLGGFKLTKWLSNDKHVLAAVPDKDKATAAVNIDLDGQKTEKRLCKQQCGWDEEISQDYASTWQEWLRDLPTLAAVSIKRCFIPPDFQQPIRREMHHFADASTSGYAVVTYLRVADDDGKVHCAFVMGKTRLAPLKAVTVPRLELQAATLATR